MISSQLATARQRPRAIDPRRSCPGKWLQIISASVSGLASDRLFFNSPATEAEKQPHGSRSSLSPAEVEADRTEDMYAVWLWRWTAGCLLLLLLGTYRLWLPRGDDSFPQIPLVSAIGPLAPAVDMIALAIMLIGLVVALAGRNVRRAAAVLFVAGAILSVVGDQQRLQPWLYFAILLQLAYLLTNRAGTLAILRVVLIGVYAYSAAGKLDYQFLNSVGQQMLVVLLKLAGVDATEWTSATLSLLAVSLPLAEGLLAVGLVFGRSRRLAGILACLFHLTLIIVFSPVGLNHSWGVLLWNVQFAGQALLVFSLPATARSAANLESDFVTLLAVCRDAPNRIPLVVLLLLSVILPLGERSQLWDHWPSWALYAPHSSRCIIQTAASEVDKLPASLQPLVADQLSHSEDTTVLWVTIPLGQWALQETLTPIYPQDRLQYAAARYLAEQIDSEFTIRAFLQSSADRFSGKRESVELSGSQRIESAKTSFFLNTKARP